MFVTQETYITATRNHLETIAGNLSYRLEGDKAYGIFTQLAQLQLAQGVDPRFFSEEHYRAIVSAGISAEEQQEYLTAGQELQDRLTKPQIVEFANLMVDLVRCYNLDDQGTTIQLMEEIIDEL